MSDNHTTSNQSPYGAFVFSRRFFPMFWVQFLGAFNDNLFKNALVMLITFRLAETAAEAGLMVTLAAGIFILPFFVMSSFAGQLADKYEKSYLIRKIKLAEILIMLLGAVALVTQDVMLLFVVLFFMGAQSAFFGPIKYSILPEHLKEDELLHGNGWFSASTFVAILLGTLVGGWVVLTEGGEDWMALTIVGMAVVGYVASRFVPAGQAGDDSIEVQWNWFKSTWQEVAHSHQYPQAFFAVLAISWFWFLGATYLSQIPVLVKEYLSGDEQVVLIFLASFSVGIGIGAWLVSRFEDKVRDILDVRRLVWFLVAISVAMVFSNLLLTDMERLPLPIDLATFLSSFDGVMVLALMLFIATFGGIFIVPLYTLLQVQTPSHSRSRMVAVNNITNSIFMVVSAVFIMLLYALEWNLVEILYTVAILNLLVAFWYQKRSATLSAQS